MRAVRNEKRFIKINEMLPTTFNSLAFDTELWFSDPHVCQNYAQKYAIQWGSVWHASPLKSGHFYRKYDARH